MAVALFLMTACESQIYSDLSECPQGVHFRFHVQTPCMSGPTYPKQLREVRVFAFDEQGVLLREFAKGDLSLSPDFVWAVDHYRIGTTTFVAWGGEDLSKYDFSAFELGKTKQTEMMVSLYRQAEVMEGHAPAIYVGTPIEGAIKQEDRTDIGTIFDQVTFNMTQLTNLIRFAVYGLNDAHSYDFYIEDDNGRYHLDGSFAPDTRFRYVTNHRLDDKGVLVGDFTTLKLAQNRNARVVIFDRDLNQIVYETNLIEGLIMYQGAYRPSAEGGPSFSLECDHVFNVVLYLQPQPTETYIGVRASINGWNIVFRTESLGK